ncbi:type III secretion system chaperone [Vibrio tubiashii]|uniref:CesT family type III secretion system chaperone n=1 Tax=Vibrio tubiashii TaxID=29498 RepID=UPI001EFDCE07|nr:CesT family type III secretion system chaperone [Vibrio tubiashii]MCG9578005.1 type III secretion system chaperone [Vibrio tubiashii]
MSARQKIDEVLTQFAHQIGLPELRLTDNELSLAFDDAIRVHFLFHPEQETLQLEAEVVNLSVLSSDLCRSLLAFNHHWPEYELFFSLDNNRNVLCLHKLLTSEKLEYTYFESALAELITQCESWESLLTAFETPEQNLCLPNTADLRV